MAWNHKTKGNEWIKEFRSQPPKRQAQISKSWTCASFKQNWGYHKINRLEISWSTRQINCTWGHGKRIITCSWQQFKGPQWECGSQKGQWACSSWKFWAQKGSWVLGSPKRRLWTLAKRLRDTSQRKGRGTFPDKKGCWVPKKLESIEQTWKRRLNVGKGCIGETCPSTLSSKWGLDSRTW